MPYGQGLGNKNTWGGEVVCSEKIKVLFIYDLTTQSESKRQNITYDKHGHQASFQAAT